MASLRAVEVKVEDRWRVRWTTVLAGFFLGMGIAFAIEGGAWQSFFCGVGFTMNTLFLLSMTTDVVE